MQPQMPDLRQIIGMLFRKQNPQSLVVSYLRSNNNEGSLNLADMIEKGDTAGIEQLARNAGKERGVNVDELKSNLENQINSFFRMR